MPARARVAGAEADPDLGPIGRQAEREALAGFASSLRRGPAALVIEGPLGVGKTTLWREGLRIAESQGCRTLVARPSEAELPLACSALGDLMERVPAEALATLPAPQRRAVESALVGDDDGGGRRDWRAASLGLLALVRRLATSAPLVVAVDDLQWLDSPTARVLAFLVRRLTVERVGLLGTVRREGPRRFAVEALLEARPLTRLEPGPLPVRQLDELVRRRLGTGLARPALARVHRASGGNPLGALEMAAELLQAQPAAAPADPVPVPHRLVDLLAPRLARLQAGARLALAAVAALAEPRLETVSGALARHPAGASGLRLALQAGVLRERDGRLACPEAMLATTAYQALTARDRRLLHEAIAGFLDEPDERAWHLALARPEVDTELAGRLELAGRRALARGASDVAACLSEQAVLHTPAEAARDGRRRSLQAADGWFAAGDLPRCRAILDDLARGWPDEEERAAVYSCLGWVARDERGWTAARALFLQAERRSGRESAAAARTQLALAWTAEGQGRLAEAAARARDAARRAIRPGQPELEREAGALLAFVEAQLGRPDAMERLAGTGQAAGGGEPVAPHEPPAGLLARAYVWQGDADRARGLFELLLREAAACGRESSRPLLLARLAEAECWAGAWRRALGLAEEGYELARSCGQLAVSGSLLCVRGLAAVHLGRVEDARAWAEAGTQRSVESGDAAAELLGRQVLGLVELWTGRPAEAHAHLGAVVARLRASGAAEPGLYRFLPDEVQALVSLGRLDEARALLAWWRRAAGELGRLWVGPIADRCAGTILSAAGDLEGAAAFLQRAAEGSDRLGPFERGRIHLQLGVVRRRLKQRAAARASLRRAVEVFRDLGAGRWADSAACDLRRAGERPASGDLTTTETHVAELVAQGWTNPEIARRLFISPRTVEANLTSVYRKLGVSGRVRLARRLVPAVSARDPGRQEEWSGRGPTGTS
jgi:DNA-binding CsgD family transcriptional regulator